MQYANGHASQEAIFQVARRLMHENGYKSTTFSMISKAADVPVSLVNYYYKKQDLVGRVYGDYIASIRNLIRRQAGSRLTNRLQTHILLSHILLTQIFVDPQTLIFHLEVEASDLVPQDVHDAIRIRQVQILEDYQVDITQENYYLCAAAEYGARRELIRNNRTLRPGMPEFQDFLEILSTIAVRVAGLDREVIDESLQRCREIFRTLDYREIQMFPDN